MRHFFIFGREPEISRAELISKFKVERIDCAIVDEGADFFICDIGDDFDAEKFISQLGGTVKIGTIERETAGLDERALFDLIKPQDKKVNFGVSAYGFNPDINKLGKNLKQLLTDAGQKSRFVASKQYPLSSVIVQKELLKNGLELALLKTKNKLFIGRTLAVQPFEQFSRLDYGRPARDPRSGMLPPKLATMMINLSETEKDEILLDPFCGSGTILQQAMLLDYKNIISADISADAVQSARDNVKWLETQIQKKFHGDIFQSDVKNLQTRISAGTISAIVTEPYLGPVLKGNEKYGKICVLIDHLKSFYQNAFRAMFNILKPNGIIVIVIPELHLNKKIYKLDVGSLTAGKFKILGRWHYQRPDQFIARQILRMIKIQ